MADEDAVDEAGFLGLPSLSAARETAEKHSDGLAGIENDEHRPAPVCVLIAPQASSGPASRHGLALRAHRWS